MQDSREEKHGFLRAPPGLTLKSLETVPGLLLFDAWTLGEAGHELERRNLTHWRGLTGLACHQEAARSDSLKPALFFNIFRRRWMKSPSTVSL